MIVECPQCEAQFRVPAEKIGEDGRDVKCSNCAHTWFVNIEGINDIEDLQGDIQSEPLENNYSETDVDDNTEQGNEHDVSDVEENDSESAPPEEHGLQEEDEPQQESQQEIELDQASAVEGGQNSEPDRVEPVNELTQAQTLKDRIVRVALTSLILFVIAFIVLSALKPILSRIMPFSGYYNILNTSAKSAEVTQNIVFDKLSAVQKGNTIKIVGALINLSDQSHDVPAMKVTFLDASHAPLKSFAIIRPAEKIDAEQTLDFTAKFDVGFETASDMVLEFGDVLKDAENTVEVHEGAQSHSDDHH